MIKIKNKIQKTKKTYLKITKLAKLKKNILFLRFLYVFLIFNF